MKFSRHTYVIGHHACHMMTLKRRQTLITSLEPYFFRETPCCHLQLIYKVMEHIFFGFPNVINSWDVRRTLKELFSHSPLTLALQACPRVLLTCRVSL